MAISVADEARIIMVVERTCSALSVIGIVTIIATFFSSRYFRNPIDRLIFINAFYNIFDITATMISVSGPAAGNASPLCQFQGFLMQMFPQCDVLWTLAMAIDVYLIVFHRYDARGLVKLEKTYAAAITVFTIIPAIVFLFIHTADKGPMYGGVTIWCAINTNWVLYRIIFYYGPIWAAVVIIIVLYCLVGWKIVVGKRALRSVESDIIALDTQSSYKESDDMPAAASVATTASSSGDGIVATTTTTVTAGPAADWPLRSPSRDGAESTAALRPGGGSSTALAGPAGPTEPTGPMGWTGRGRLWNSHWYMRRRTVRTTRSAFSLRQYFLLPILFTVVTLAVWVAPSTNRVLSFVHPSFTSFPLHLAAGATGSLRGFWNAVVFITVGLRSRQSQKKLEAAYATRSA